jgi:transcriptional antiterminator NusG
MVESRGMQEQIIEVSVPMQNVVEIKNGQKKTALRKVLPGYVLVLMYMNDDTWYVVRNTRGVTSFVGPGSKPVPLTEEEMRFMGVLQEGQEEFVDLDEGMRVRIIEGPFADSVGYVTEINRVRKVVIVALTVFGRETPVELDYLQVEKVS